MPLGTTAPPAPGQLTRHRLGNGLTVVLLPDPEVPAVAVAVGYDVGYRSEARPGFAHLFEHLMFQGSSSLPKLAHAERVQAAGGAFNAVTQRDHTCYYQVVPAQALELVLFLEADRMRGPRITPETIANQVAVVTEEINQNFLGRPYGGFPAFALPPVLFRDEANSHNGYGDTRSLSGVSPEECERFFADHYGPGGAVLAISGAFDPRHALDLAHTYFGALPARPGPPRRDHAEPPPDQERAHTLTDRLAPPPRSRSAGAAPRPAAPSTWPTCWSRRCSATRSTAGCAAPWSATGRPPRPRSCPRSPARPSTPAPPRRWSPPRSAHPAAPPASSPG
nr:pitrilysin family protein [Actinacidiphila yeochonensis]